MTLDCTTTVNRLMRVSSSNLSPSVAMPVWYMSYRTNLAGWSDVLLLEPLLLMGIELTYINFYTLVECYFQIFYYMTEFYMIVQRFIS